MRGRRLDSWHWYCFAWLVRPQFVLAAGCSALHFWHELRSCVQHAQLQMPTGRASRGTCALERSATGRRQGRAHDGRMRHDWRAHEGRRDRHAAILFVRWRLGRCGGACRKGGGQRLPPPPARGVGVVPSHASPPRRPRSAGDQNAWAHLYNSSARGGPGGRHLAIIDMTIRVISAAAHASETLAKHGTCFLCFLITDALFGAGCRRGGRLCPWLQTTVNRATRSKKKAGKIRVAPPKAKAERKPGRIVR